MSRRRGHAPRRPAAFLGALACLLLAPAGAGAGAGEPPAEGAPADLADLLEPVRAKHEVPALAAAVVTRARLVGLGATGVRALGAEARVTAADLWHVGSCTKAMTAALIGRLVDEGRLRWDTTLGEALPDLRAAMHAGWRDVPLRLLLAHRGGAPSDLGRDGLWGRLWRHHGTPVQARRLLAQEVLRHAPAYEPGTRHRYANAGYALAGHAVETVMERPFETLLRERVFAPLGMDGAGFGAPGQPGRLDQPLGHREAEGRLVPVPPGPGADNPVAITPAGRVHLPMADWARFVRVFLGTGGEEGALLEAGTLRALATPPEGQTYALGWATARRAWGGGTVLTHAGSNTLWHAVAWVAPQADFAVLVACNAGGERGAAACDAAAGALVGWHRRGTSR